eukprot:1512702-Alexandrium_andersonii.AAC.1
MGWHIVHGCRRGLAAWLGSCGGGAVASARSFWTPCPQGAAMGACAPLSVRASCAVALIAQGCAP